MRNRCLGTGKTMSLLLGIAVADIAGDKASGRYGNTISNTGTGDENGRATDLTMTAQVYATAKTGIGRQQRVGTNARTVSDVHLIVHFDSGLYPRVLESAPVNRATSADLHAVADNNGGELGDLFAGADGIGDKTKPIGPNDSVAVNDAVVTEAAIPIQHDQRVQVTVGTNGYTASQITLCSDDTARPYRDPSLNHSTRTDMDIFTEYCIRRDKGPWMYLWNRVPRAFKQPAGNGVSTVGMLHNQCCGRAVSERLATQYHSGCTCFAQLCQMPATGTKTDTTPASRVQGGQPVYDCGRVALNPTSEDTGEFAELIDHQVAVNDAFCAWNCFLTLRIVCCSTQACRGCWH